MSLFLGIDTGTSATKALLLDASGRVAATATAPHALRMPRPGWSEQRPEEWWAAAADAARAAMRRARAAARDVAAVGLSGQMHGSVLLDARGRCLGNALLWNDQRTGAECRQIERAAGGRRELIRLVRNVALTGYTAPKLLWLRAHRRRLFARARTLLLPKDYVRFRLTGTLGSDVSDASGTLLFDVAARTWSAELIRRLRLDPELFPPTVESQTVVGEIVPSAARALGLRTGTPVVAGAGDQPAAAVGAGVVRPGVVSATIGTSGVVFAYGPRPVPNGRGLLQSFCHAVPGAWCAFGCMLSAGGSLQWARRVLTAERLSAARREAQRDALYQELLDEAARSDASQTPIFLPYLTGERCPYPHPHARGAWIGLTARHTRGDLVRALVEGVTYGMWQQINLLGSAGLRVRQVHLAGGGARHPWWRQLQADVYGRPCALLATEEGSALGAAILAAAGVGQFPSVAAACEAAVRIRGWVRPVRAQIARHRERAALAARVYEVLEPLFRTRF